MRKRIQLFLWLACLTVNATVSFGQAQPTTPPPTLEQRLGRNWVSVQKKILDMAKDLPDAKYDFRPTPESRSFRQEFWHMIASNQYMLSLLKGEKVDTQKLFSDEGKPAARADIIAQLESSGKEVSTLLKSKFDGRIVGMLEHAAEHYGKLVVMFRLNGIVPPVSRTQPGS